MCPRSPQILSYTRFLTPIFRLASSPSFSLPARRHILEATSDQRHGGHPVNLMVGARPNHCVCNCSYAVSDITGSPLCSLSITLAIISPVRLHLTL